MALVSYHKHMLQKVKMQRTQQFSTFSLLPKEPSKMQRMRSKSKFALEEIRLFLENHPLEFHEIWHENTSGNK